MGLPITLSEIAPRISAGAFILNSGLGKRGADAEAAAGMHGFASGTYPFLKDVDPATFVRVLSYGEIAVVPDEDAMVAYSDQIAAEHLQVHTRDAAAFAVNALGILIGFRIQRFAADGFRHQRLANGRTFLPGLRRHLTHDLAHEQI